MEINALYNIFLKKPKISTDSRNILEDSIFFALQGDNFNGNLFAKDALNKGAAYAVVDDPSIADSDRIILVKNVLNTLQQLAAHHRNQFEIPFLAITGSNGKTTTKELIHAVLSEGFRVYATRGNLNNHIGVPLTLLEISADTEIAIIEMGANHQQEIEGLCKIARPTHGVITNIGKAHLEGFGGFEGVKKAKGELYDYLKANNGHIFIQGGNQVLTEALGGYDLVTTYGIATEISEKTSFDFTGSLHESNPFLSFYWKTATTVQYVKTQTQLVGSYNLENAIAAIAIGSYFGLTSDKISEGISKYTPTNNRSQVVETKKGNHLICDYYNANASSMAAALENFAHVQSSNRVIILGDMFELGDSSVEEHKIVIENVCALDVKKAVLIGKHFSNLKSLFLNRSANIHFFETLTQAYEELNKNPILDSWVLVKGSRGMTLEKLIPLL